MIRSYSEDCQKNKISVFSCALLLLLLIDQVSAAEVSYTADVVRVGGQTADGLGFSCSDSPSDSKFCGQFKAGDQIGFSYVIDEEAQPGLGEDQDPASPRRGIENPTGPITLTVNGQRYAWTSFGAEIIDDENYEGSLEYFDVQQLYGGLDDVTLEPINIMGSEFSRLGIYLTEVGTAENLPSLTDGFILPTDPALADSIEVVLAGDGTDGDVFSVERLVLTLRANEVRPAQLQTAVSYRSIYYLQEQEGQETVVYADEFVPLSGNSIAVSAEVDLDASEVVQDVTWDGSGALQTASTYQTGLLGGTIKLPFFSEPVALGLGDIQTYEWVREDEFSSTGKRYEDQINLYYRLPEDERFTIEFDKDSNLPPMEVIGLDVQIFVESLEQNPTLLNTASLSSLDVESFDFNSGKNIIRVALIGDDGKTMWVNGEDRLDEDGDGIVDQADSCIDTAMGAKVDARGCSVAQYAPCQGDWKNHGRYVSTLSGFAEQFLSEGILTVEEKDAIVSSAAKSSCGKTAKKSENSKKAKKSKKSDKG